MLIILNIYEGERICVRVSGLFLYCCPNCLVNLNNIIWATGNLVTNKDIQSISCKFCVYIYSIDVY